MSDVKVRIAPSPTGDPHVGTAYIGLLNMVFARQNQGKLVLRIEDTDQTRSSAVCEAAILRSLKWFGLSWDEGPDVGGPNGPYRQSERTDLYKQHADMLIETGHAYRCFCTPDRLKHLRDSQKADKSPFLGYDRFCRNLSKEEVDQLLSLNQPYVIRLKMPSEGALFYQDMHRGQVIFQYKNMDDQVLLKNDGYPTYHLANVVDDHLMGITHVIRAEEWLTSVPKHIQLYNAFDWKPPVFVHVPLLRNSDKNKTKISKRKNPVSLVYYEQSGHLPEALRNYLAMLGWTHPDSKDIFSTDEMIEKFRLEDISLGGPVFDVHKLKWLNGEYIRLLDETTLKEKLCSNVFDPSYIAQIIPLVHQRMEVFEDFWKYADYFFVGDLSYDLGQLPPNKSGDACKEVLNGLLEKLEQYANTGWDPQGIKDVIMKIIPEGWSTSELMHLLRVVITAKTATPPIFAIMAVLGKDRVRRRFQHFNNLV